MSATIDMSSIFAAPQHFTQDASALKLNDWLRLASTFHRCITSALSPAHNPRQHHALTAITNKLAKG